MAVAAGARSRVSATRALPDPLAVQILPFMEDPHHLDFFASISEEEHVRQNRKAPNPLLNLGTVGPDLSRGFSQQPTPGLDPKHHVGCNGSTRRLGDVDRDLPKVAPGRRREPDGSQAASDRRAFRISSNTSSAEA